MKRIRSLGASAAALLVLGAPLLLGVAVTGLHADMLQLKDGRVIEGVPMERIQGGVKVKYKHGDVVIADRLIRDFLQSNPDGTFKPRDDADAEKMAKGLVPYQGKWIPKNQYDRIRKKQIDAYKERIEEARKHKKWRDRYQTETKNFRFEYTIPRETAQEFMDLFETYFKTFAKAWGIRRGKVGKLKVCFYHDEDYFHQVSGAGWGVGGYFRFVDPIELNVYNRRNDKRETEKVIFHEVNHFLVHLIDPKFHYSLWINEGLAEYYGSSDWDPKRKKMKVGLIQEGRLVSVKDDIDEGDWLGLEEMIQMEGSTIKHYTWGWSFCHFMLHTPKYTKKYKKFFKALALGNGVKREPFAWGMQKVGPEETIRLLKKFLGVKDLKKLEKEWHDYIKTNLKTQTARGYVEAARMAERNDLSIKAQNLYKKALKAGCKSHECYFNYGMLLWRKNKEKEAIEMFEKAIEVDPLDAYSYLYIGLSYRDLGGKDNKKKAERYKQLAFEVDPYDDDLHDLAELSKIRIKR